MTTTDEPPDEVYEEQEAHDLRRALGLRPVAYLSDGKGPHPDSRPCPDWCWNKTSGYLHDVEQEHPLDAVHRMDGVPGVALSLYEAEPGRGASSDRWTVLSTLEPWLEQVGQSDPQIHFGLREYRGREPHYQHDFLRLALDDARHLVTVLSHLIDTGQRDGLRS